jgi:hypothetical protein
LNVVLTYATLEVCKARQISLTYLMYHEGRKLKQTNLFKLTIPSPKDDLTVHQHSQEQLSSQRFIQVFLVGSFLLANAVIKFLFVPNLNRKSSLEK